MAVILMVACWETETGDLTPLGGPLYETWFMETAACLGQVGRSPFEVDIFSTPILRDKATGLNLYGLFRPPNNIILVEGHETDRVAFTHEVIHYLGIRGCHTQIPYTVWVRCTGKGYNPDFEDPRCRT